MTQNKTSKPTQTDKAQAARAARLKAALKANIAKRKAQARGRDTNNLSTPQSDK